MKIAVIPDIHGQLDALKAFLEAIRRCGGEASIVQLGDFIDRGPESRACVELLMKLQRKGPGKLVVLKGNHEDLLCRSEGDAGALAAWMSNGGAATLKSYGKDFEALCRGHGSHAAWLRDLPLSWEQAGIFFCHAGLGPAGEASEQDLLWRRPPLGLGAWKAVVCGHTPTASGGVELNRGVFCCDLGLGHHAPKRLEYLELDAGETVFKWEIKAAL